MSIISKLNEYGVVLTPTKSVFCGYRNTECGTTGCCDVADLNKKVYRLEIKKEGKNAITLPCRDFDVSIKTPDGETFTFNAYDLYSEYYNFNEDENLEYYFKYGYGKKTRKYIETVMRKIGFVNYTDACNGSCTEEGDPIEFKKFSTYENIYINATTEVGRNEDNMWVAQTIFRCDIDDFAVIKMYFRHKPTKKDIKTAFVIRELDNYPIPEVCWDLKSKKKTKKINWIEVKGDLSKKYEYAKSFHIFQ